VAILSYSATVVYQVPSSFFPNVLTFRIVQPIMAEGLSGIRLQEATDIATRLR